MGGKATKLKTANQKGQRSKLKRQNTNATTFAATKRDSAPATTRFNPKKPKKAFSALPKGHHMIHLGSNANQLAHGVVVVAGHVGEHGFA
jgi:hypothetical protein